MINQWILSFAISFVMRQLAKFQKTLDWAKVKADLDARVRQLVPGSWLDDDAVNLCDALLQAAEKALGEEAAIEGVLKLIAAEKWAEAGDSLKAMVLKDLKETDVLGQVLGQVSMVA